MNKIISIIIILLIFTLINLSVHQVTLNQDKIIREDAIRYVSEFCYDTPIEEYGDWMVNFSEVPFNVS